MQIVIDIPDDTTKLIEECIKFDNMIDLDVYDIVLNGIKNGTPLPKGHGRLIDADKTLEVAWQDFYKHETEWEEKDKNYLPLHRFYDQNGFGCCHQTIVNAPTIIEAEKGDKE